MYHKNHPLVNSHIMHQKTSDRQALVMIGADMIKMRRSYCNFFIHLLIFFRGKRVKKRLRAPCTRRVPGPE